MCIVTLFHYYHMSLQRTTEEKARQPETKLGASRGTQHKARLRNAKRSRIENPKPTHGVQNRPINIYINRDIDDGNRDCMQMCIRRHVWVDLTSTSHRKSLDCQPRRAPLAVGVKLQRIRCRYLICLIVRPIGATQCARKAVPEVNRLPFAGCRKACCLRLTRAEAWVESAVIKILSLSNALDGLETCGVRSCVAAS
jgi:hypothetical protein